MYCHILYIYISKTLLYMLYELHIIGVIIAILIHKVRCLKNIYIYFKIYVLCKMYIIDKNNIYIISFLMITYLIKIKILYEYSFICEMKSIV